MTDDLPLLQGGMTNEELHLAWAKKLPGVAPTDNQLSCFAIGVEVGYAVVCAAAVAQEQERIKAALMRMHNQAQGQHNYYHCAVVALFGDDDV